MARRLLILHGHFYQPPRENPWLEQVEVQDSANPFHDWNERISAECYSPNGAARQKTPDGRITEIVNNYTHLSFNFGPTLLSWMERADPAAYDRILAADRHSVRARGHGNAIAQAYSHPIVPLCTPRDRRTQVLWGLADFRRRFGRDPEGMWLPEAGVDRDTLRELAQAGLRFTILSPYQATRVRAPGGAWQSALGGQFDPARPYRVELGDGLSIAVFFYDGPIARSFAFETGLQTSGAEMLKRLELGFDASRGHDEVLTVAIDGETFGHHRKGADEILASCLNLIASRRDDLELVNPGQALERVPPEWEAEIAERTSWSCVHGLERWKSDCGCQGNGHHSWRQHWREPLRAALDGLRDQLAPVYEREAGRLFDDPWRTRDEYIEVVADPERAATDAFLERQAGRRLEGADRVRALQLLEMQRHAMLMYTSCGWFFSELSGLETVQILKYAARAIQLAREAAGADLEPGFKEALAKAPSNLPEFQNGARVWEVCVKPSVVSLEGVPAHHAIATLFDPERSGRIFCYRFGLRSRRRETVGPATLAVGRIELESLVTGERLDASYCVLHFGGSDFRCGLRPFVELAQHAEIERVLFSRLSQLSLAQVVREIDRVFTGRDYTLRDLFLDGRRRMASLLLRETLRRYESDYQEIFDENHRLMEFLREIDSPIPTQLRAAADLSLTGALRRLIDRVASGKLDLAAIREEFERLVHLARRLGARLDLDPLKAGLHALIEERLAAVTAGPHSRPLLMEIVEIARLGQRLEASLDLSGAQNAIWSWIGSPSAPPLEPDELRRLAQELWFDLPSLERRAVRAAELDAALGTAAHAGA